ncbi:hypothetical protein G4O51_03370 [Candidatus Bathyarchaeota archaeon A05DMB-2]|nr:hypothetical protein [Candidatus Bathyarchaeota archaeon A05DMB-2]
MKNGFRTCLPDDKKIETLVRLGLTNNQARVYLSALQTRKASVKTISQSAKVGREDVYRIMPSL